MMPKSAQARENQSSRVRHGEVILKFSMGRLGNLEVQRVRADSRFSRESTQPADRYEDGKNTRSGKLELQGAPDWSRAPVARQERVGITQTCRLLRVWSGNSRL